MEMRELSMRKADTPRPASVQFVSSQDTRREREQAKSKLSRSKTFANTKLDIKMPSQRLRHQDSVGAIEELVVCGMCLSIIKNPKMLHCQHTFCADCLKQLLEQLKLAPIECPVCKNKSIVENVDNLPSNIYLNNLIILLMNENDDSNSLGDQSLQTGNGSCAICKTICQEQNIVKCQHCKMQFCGVCFPQHADELTSRYPKFLEQLDEHENSLTMEQNQYKRHCDHLVEEIKHGIAEKIKQLQDMGTGMFQEVQTLHESGSKEILSISENISILRDSIQKHNEIKPHTKVVNYLDFHHQLSKILDSISGLASNYKQINMETFHLDDPPTLPEQPSDFIYEEISTSLVNMPAMLESYYKNKVFSAKSMYLKFQKPTGICSSPWDPNLLFVCNMNTIYVYDVPAENVILRIQDDNMTCPQSIACNSATYEIFVSDKWQNVIHVFNPKGDYLRKLSPRDLKTPHGIALDKDGDLLVCDTGNDRLIIIDTTSGKIKNTIGVKHGITELSMPTDVSTNGKIIAVADVGNHRIKIFDADTLLRSNEIGSLGKQSGQFRSAEVVHVDAGGFIIVGDSGNKRIQIFNADGKLIQCTSSKYAFSWISGICTFSKVDIIVTDYKSKSVVRF